MSGTGTGWESPGAVNTPAAPTVGGGGTGTGWEAPGAAPAAPAVHSSGGGGLFGSIGHDLGSVGHFISSRAATGMSTIKSIGTGLYGAAKTGAIDPWWNLITTGHPYAHNTGNKIDAETNAVLGGTIVGPVNAVHDVTSGHFKDPIGDVIQFLPAAHGLARTGIGAAEAGAALRSGEGVGAAAKAFKSPEFLQSPRLVGEPGREPVSLYGSHNAARRLVQAGIDRAVNKALANDRANGLLGHEGPIAKYGKARMGGTVADYARASIRYRQAMVATTRVAARGVARFAKSIKADVQNPELTAQALLHSLHDNVLPEHEAILHEQQAARGINPEQNTAWAQAFNDAAKLGAVHLTPDNRVVINEGHPLTGPLSHADDALAKLGAYTDNEIVARGLRDPLELADRRGRVAQLVQRGNPLQGEEPQPLREARRAVGNVQRKLTTANERERVATEKQQARIAKASQGTGGRSVELGNPHREAIVTLGHQLEAAKQRVTSLEDRYGYSSSERRTAMQQGVAARERVAEAAHRLFGDQAAQHLAQIEGFARQWARVNDRTPQEWYAQFLHNTLTPNEISDPTLAELHEIAAFHGFDATKTAKNLAAKLNPRTQKSGMPSAKAVLTKEGIHFSGDITPEAWVRRVLYTIPDLAERDYAARWYEHFEPVFRKHFPPDIVEKIMRAFAVSQANAGVSEGIGSSIVGHARLEAGEDITRQSLASLAADNIEKALKGEHIDSGVAAKLSDFIDALRGSGTRTWMGHDVRGGMPAPSDVWSGRDIGHIDRKIGSKGRDKRLLNMHGVDVNKLEKTSTGSYSGRKYEYIAEKYHQITDHLNAIKFDGRDDWTPAQAQALGWATIQKFYGEKPEDLAGAILKGHKVAAGIMSRNALKAAVSSAHEPDGGFTLHPDLSPDTSTEGHVVALAAYEHRVPAAELTTKDVTDYARAHKALLRNPNLRVGGWHNPADGQVYLDIARVVPTREEALSLAREQGQLSVYDRAAAGRGDWENAFPESGLSAAEADAIKNEARVKAQSPEEYKSLLATIAERELGRRPNAHDLALTEDNLHAAAESAPEDPASIRFKQLYSDAHAELQSRMPQPEDLFQQNGGHIAGSYNPEQGLMRLSSEHARPETILHEALHAVRQSLSPTVSEIARRMYAPNGWDRAAEERFVEDMQRAASGEPVSPEVQRLFLMTHTYTPGRGYVPMSIYENARQAHSPMSSSPGPIIGQTKQPLETKYATGEATAQGLRRTDVAEAVTQHVQKLFRYFNTIDHRDLAAKFGSDTSMSKSDVLVRYDRRTEAGYKLPAQKVSSALKETLGLLENKTGLPAPEEEGLSAGVAAVLRDFVGEMFPKLGSDPELRRVQDEAAATGRGVQAPAGYKWVPQEIARLKDLEAAVTRGEPGRIGRFADNVNGAITAATVYYKVGHVFTRVLTNAATNIMQGSAAPWQIARSVQLFHALTEDEIHEALAYSGTHYYEAAPGAQGGTVVGKGLQKGLHVPFTDLALRTKSGEAVMSPQWWAHNIDAPFRFNSLAFEARQAGYEGVDGFRSFLQDVQHYKGLDGADRARVDGVLRRADREVIAYDRMNQFEKKWLSRIIWFYPWIKGSTVFTANSILEHPFKTAALYGYGEQGAQERDKALGDLPSYAQGLTPLTGGDEPVVSDFNTFNPFSTAGDLLGVPEHLQNAAGMANPFYGAILNTAEGVNPYGAHTPTPISDNLKGLLTSAPEYQILEGAMNNGDQSHKLYPGGHGLDPLYKNWLGELVRSLGGPATPRHINPNAGHSLAQRERTGR